MSLIPNGSVVTHIQCLESELNNIPIVNGQLIYTSDTNKLYWDVNNNRQVITDIIIITENEYNNLLAPLNTFYYISDSNKLMYYNGTNWILINENKQIWYGVCSTAAATQAKTVTIEGVTELSEGLFILVSFTNDQTYNGVPTLNVNSLGAKNICRLTGTNAARYEWQAGEVLPLVYNGTYWVILDGGIATTTYYGVTKLNTSATSTSTSTALTPASLNSLAKYMLSGAEVYSTSATYAVGDRVRYGSYIYVCIIAITTAEQWNADHWQVLPSLLDLIDNRMMKPTSASNGNLPVFDSYKEIIDSGIRVSNWIERGSDPVGIGNFISWNASAQGVDSGKNASSFASNTHTHSEYAPLASPNFTGIPNVPLANSGDNSNQIASTNFVQNELLNHYGVSTTAAGTTAKVATTIGGHFKKSNGNSVKVRFTYRNTVNNITLNVDSTGASNVVMGENNSNVADMWVSNSIVEFIFDGTNYCMVDRFIANTTNYGLTKLVDSVSNTSTLYAATPNAVNAAYTRASLAYTQANSAYNQANSAYANANLPQRFNVSLNITWITNGNNYEKTISTTNIPNFNQYTQVDLVCNATILQNLLDAKCKGMYFENRDGNLYLIAVGNKPTVSMTVSGVVYSTVAS